MGIFFRIALMAAMALATFPSAAQAGGPAAPSSDVPGIAYEHAQTLVTLPDARRLNLFCMGKGMPVVMLEAGGGDDSLSFRKVQGRLANVTRVCSYDRTGMGFSDPPDHPNTATRTVNDLHELIRKASIPLPVILVGHSDGGLYATLYAAEFPRDVAGMVLIDPMTLGQDVTATRVLNQKELLDWRKGNQADIKQAHLCLNLALSGALARTPERYPNCMDNPPNTDPDLHRLLNEQLARPGEQRALLWETLDTYPPTNGGLSRAELTLQRARFDFGDKPFIVLSATDERFGLPEARGIAVWRALEADHVALAAHSTHGVHMTVGGSGHYIQIDQPDAVIHAVIDVVTAARKSPAPGR